MPREADYSRAIVSASSSYARVLPGRHLAVLAALGLAAMAALALALAVGSVELDSAALFRALTGGDGTESAIVRELRLPRALAAFAVGGLLALSGALMQVLLRNPLADPYILGISGGAAVGALTAMVAGAAALVTPGALLGALASTLLVFSLARTGAERAPWTTTRLLLTGVVVAAGWGALIALLLTLAPDAQVKGMLFWLIGDLGGAIAPAPALITLVVALAVSFGFRAGLERAVARRGRGRRAGHRRRANRGRAVRAGRIGDSRGRHDGRQRGIRRARRSPRATPRGRQ
jgi:iron complex transport system permease protein